jgi:hypothetical protein
MPAVPKLPDAAVEEISKILGDTDDGFTGTEIGRLLEECGIDDIASGATKWKRLHAALTARQRRDQVANAVLAFIKIAMAPIRYRSNPQRFEERRDEVNKVLSFAGLTIGRDGSLSRTGKVSTLDEASKKARRLREELLRRRVHGDVLLFCRSELLQENYFHAVFEAAKSVADKIRDVSGLTTDGSRLVDGAGPMM